MMDALSMMKIVFENSKKYNTIKDEDRQLYSKKNNNFLDPIINIVSEL